MNVLRIWVGKTEDGDERKTKKIAIETLRNTRKTRTVGPSDECIAAMSQHHFYHYTHNDTATTTHCPAECLASEHLRIT